MLSRRAETAHLALKLSQEANTPDVLALAGWRFIVAAKRVTSSSCDPNARKRWPFFMGIARQADCSELEDPPKQTRQDRERPKKPKELPYPYQYTNGPGSPGWGERSA